MSPVFKDSPDESSPKLKGFFDLNKLNHNLISFDIKENAEELAQSMLDSESSYNLK